MSLDAIALATVWNMYCELDQRPDNWIEVEGLEPASKLGFDEGDFAMIWKDILGVSCGSIGIGCRRCVICTMFII